MPFNVLVVENSAVMRQYLERAIGIGGFPASCVAAANSREAMRLLEATPMDLIIMDTNTFIPGEKSLLEQVCENATLQSVPCIVISAEATATRIQNVLDLGASAHLAKPLDPTTLRAEMRRVLEARHAQN